MTYKVDFNIANSTQIEHALCKRVESVRLSRNMTQAQLAQEAAVSLKTIYRLEKGAGVSLDTFIRVLIALRIQGGLEALLPDPAVKPVERVGIVREGRRRARGSAERPGRPGWTWGDGGTGDD